MPRRSTSLSELAKALQALSCNPTPPPTSLYLSLLKSCIQHRHQALPFAAQLQAHITHCQIPLTGLLGHYLVSALAICGSLHDALSISARLPCLTALSATALISAYTDAGSPHDALSLYQSMQDHGIQPSAYTLVSLFKACGAIADVHWGMVLHADAVFFGFVLDGFLGNTLISMYGKCAAIVEAEHVFCMLSSRDIVSWNAMLSAYVEQKEAEEALLLYCQMQDENIGPDRPTYIAALQACTILAEDADTSSNNEEVIPVEIGHMLHFDIHENNFAANVYVNSTLIRMYGKCGALRDAENVFTALHHHDVISCSAMLSAYVEGGNGEKALWLYRQLHEESINRDVLTQVLALQACGTLLQKEESHIFEGQLLSRELGQALHAEALKKGFESDAFFVKNLMNLYGKVGALAEAFDAFGMLSQHDVTTWNTLLCAIVDNGNGTAALQLYIQMQEAGVTPDQQTFMITLQACALLAEMENCFLIDGFSAKTKSLKICKSLHADACALGFASDLYICNATLSMLVKCEALLEAEEMFCALPHRNVVSSTAMLTAYVERGQGATALQLYWQMQQETADCLDELTFVIILQACTCIAEQEDVPFTEAHSNKRTSLEIGHAIHIDASRKDLLSSVIVMSALVSMYSKCGTIIEAESMFGSVTKCGTGSWRIIISAYVEHGEAEKALLCFRQMHIEGGVADRITFTAALQACAILAEKAEDDIVNGAQARLVALEIGRALHADIDKQGVVSDLFVNSTLISMYGKCGAVGEAEDAFEALPEKSIVSWNAMLSTYIRHDLKERVVWSYKQMRTQHLALDEVAVISTLQGSGTIGSLDMCKQLHFDLVCMGYDQVSPVVSALLHAYGGCASMVDAQNVFENLPKPDIVSWNACIAGHVGEGGAVASLLLFKELDLFCLEPSKVTFLMILSACGHAGLLIEGLEYFISMSKDYGLDPDRKHYGSLLDLLGRAGDFRQLEDLLEKMPMQANLPIWSCLLGACRTHINSELALQVFHDAVHFDPEEATPYVLMSNICVNAGLQEHIKGEGLCR